MKTWKKNLIRFSYVVFGLCALVAAGWFVPYPIKGNWIGGIASGCECDHHSFMRFEGGKLLEMPGHFINLHWIGTYQRKGWGRYEVNLFGATDSPIVIRSTFLRARWENLPQNFANDSVWKKPLRRDFNVSACRELLNDPECDWILCRQGMSYRVAGTPEDRLFLLYGKKRTTKEELITDLNNRLYPPPLQIYTASNDVPSCVIDTIVQSGFDYHIHANQHWIQAEWVSDPSRPGWERDRPLDTEEANPVWTNKASLIIVNILPNEDKEKDPEIYFYSGGAGKSTAFKEEIEFRARWRERWKEAFKKHVFLYVDDGILPEDVRQMFDALGINYHVRDEKILYWGKQKK